MTDSPSVANNETRQWLESNLLVLRDEQLRVPKRVHALRNILQALAQSCCSPKISERGVVGTGNALARDLPLDGVDGLVPLRSYAQVSRPESAAAAPDADDKGTLFTNASPVLPIPMAMAVQWAIKCDVAEGLFAPIRLNLAIFRAGLAFLDFLVASNSLELKHLHMLHTTATKSSMRTSVRAKIERCINNAAECIELLQEQRVGLAAHALVVDESIAPCVQRPEGEARWAPSSVRPRCGLANPSYSCHVNCLLQLLFSDVTIRQAFITMAQPLSASGVRFYQAVGRVFIRMLQGPTACDRNLSSDNDDVESNIADSEEVLKLLEAEMMSCDHPWHGASKPSRMELGPLWSMRQVLSLFDKCLGLRPNVATHVSECHSALKGCQVAERIHAEQQSPPSGPTLLQDVHETLRQSLLGFLVQTSCSSSGAKGGGGTEESKFITSRAFAMSGGLTLAIPFRKFSSLSQALAFETRSQRVVEAQPQQEMTDTFPDHAPTAAGKRDIRVALDGARLPDNLFIHVLRSGKLENPNDKEEDLAHCQFQLPELIDVSPFCHDSAQPQDSSKELPAADPKWFQLRGVVVHCNVLSSAKTRTTTTTAAATSTHHRESELEGHFIAYTRVCTSPEFQEKGEGYWVQCDDEHTQPVQPVCHNGAYDFDTDSEEVVLVLYHRVEASTNVAH